MLRVIFCLLTLLHWATIGFAQCDNKQLLLPEKNEAFQPGFGAALDTHGAYMVVGSPDHDSLGYAAGLAHVYKTNDAGQWVKIATLAPSDPQGYLNFGSMVALNETTIMITGNRYDVDGAHNEKVYVFEREPLTEWSTGTESYRIDLAEKGAAIISMELSTTYMTVMLTAPENLAKLLIFKKANGLFTQQQILQPPFDANSLYGDFGSRMALSDDLLVVAAPQFKNDINPNYYGAVFIYQRDGENWSDDPVAELLPSDESDFVLFGFGKHVSLAQNTIFVESDVTKVYPNQEQSIYIYEMPPTGWSGSLTERVAINNGPSGNWGSRIATDGTYAFLPNFNWTEIRIYKKMGSSWNDHTKVGTISLPQLKFWYNHHRMSLTGKHIVFYRPSSIINPPGESHLLDFVPTMNWENGYILNQKIEEHSFNASGDYFGHEISVFGNWMAVGAQGDDQNGEFSGAVYVYKRKDGKWVLVQKIHAPDASPHEQFGHAIAMGEKFLFVSANKKDRYDTNGNVSDFDIGSVYIFELVGDQWIYRNQMFAPQIERNNSFGQDIALSNDYVAISEFAENGTGYRGYVYVYKRDANNAWNRIATLRPSDIPDTDSFGRSIAMNDSVIVVGTGNWENHILYDMHAYVFTKKEEWRSGFEDAILVQNTDTKLWWDLFGYSVAISGDVIVVGAPGWGPDAQWNTEQFFRGAAFVFTKPLDGWKGTIRETAKLLPSDPRHYGSFGASVAIENDDIFIGSPHTFFHWNVVDNVSNDDDKLKPGIIYHYIKQDTWKSTLQEDDRIISTTPNPLDMFGASIVIANSVMYAGAPRHDTSSGMHSGSVETMALALKILEVSTPCSEDGPVKLRANIPGGLWSINDSSPQASGEFSLPAGIYTAQYTLNGCSTTQQFSVMSFGLQPGNSSPEKIEKCDYSTVSLYFQSNATPQQYFWYYKSDQSNAFVEIEENKQRIEAQNAGYYRLEIRHPRCSTYIRDFEISYLPPIAPYITPPGVICSDQPVVINATPAGGTWSDPVTPDGSIDPKNLANGAYPIRYLITTESGCEYFAETTLQVDHIVKPQIAQVGESYCFNETVKLSVTNAPAAASITWYNAADPSRPAGSEELDVKAAGSYFATLQMHSCLASSDPVEIKAQEDSLFVPNVFTPNGDNQNDVFEIKGEGLNDFRLIIVNRYGKEIYTSNQVDFAWNGEGATPGVYFWHVEYLSCQNQRKKFRGFVHLMGSE